MNGFVLSAQWRRTLAGLLLGLASAASWATTTINHQFSPATINPGDTSRYTITIANASTVALTLADVTVLFPAQITLANPPNVADNCGFAGVTADPGTSKVVLTGGTIPARVGSTDGQCTFSADVTSIVSGNHVANIPANTTPNATTSGYTAFENAVQVWNTTLADATLSVGTLQNPTGSKSFSPSPVRAGDPTTLTMVLTNPNAGATIPLTTVTDSLPAVGGAQMVVANPANATVNCTGTGAANGTVSANPGDSSFTLTGGTMGRSGACTVTVKVTVPALAAGSTSASFTNTLADGAIGNSRGLTSPAFNGSVTVNTPITMNKTFNPTSIAARQPALMTITIGNASTTNALTITSFTDNMGANFKVLTTASLPVAAPADPAVSCTGAGAANGTLTAVDGATTVSLDNAVAGPSGACTITAYVTSAVDGTQTNSIPAGAVNNPAGHTSPAVSANLSVNGQITIGKTATVTSVAPGQWTTFTVTINNWSGADVTAVTFTDNLPANGVNQMVLDTSVAPSAGSCVGSFTGNDGDSTLVWNGTVPAGVGANAGICTITFRARLPATATNGMTFNNSLPANTSVVGTGNGPAGPGTAVVNTNSASRNITAIYSADVAKSFSPTSIAQGGSSLLTVTLYNRTLAPLSNVALTDTLPAGLTLAPNPAASNTCGGSLQAFPGDNKLILTGGSLAARPDANQQSSCSFSAYVTGSTLGSYTNQIDAGAMTTNEGVTNGSTVNAGLTITTGLTGSKSFTPTSVTSGGVARAKVTVTNTTSGTLTNVSVDDDTFGAGLTVANPANAATSCAGSPTVVANPGATRAQLLGATLAAGASCDFSFDVATSGNGPWTNTVGAGKITSAEGPANTAAVTATLNIATAQLAINKSFNPVIVTGGVRSRLTIDVINNSATTIHNAGFTDTFPNGMQVFPVPNASTDCAGGTVAAVPNAGFVTLAGVTLAPSATCHVYVDVTSVKFLNLTNTIPAGAISSAEGYTNAQGTSATLSTLQGLGLMKAFAPAYIGPNQTSRLKLRLVSTYDPNALSPVILHDVSFTDNLPAGVTFAATPNPTTDCEGTGAGGLATMNVNTGTSALTLTGAVIRPNTNCAIEVDVTASAVGAYRNLIPQNTVTTTEGVTNVVDTDAWLYVVTTPTIGKTFASSPVNPGTATRLTVTVTNNAAQPLTGIALTDTLPAGLVIAGTPNAGTTCGNGVATAIAGDNDLALSGATLAAGQSCTYYADVVTNTPGSYANTIAAGRLTSSQGLTNPGPANATLEVRYPPTIAKSFSPVSIANGGTSTLTITLTNPNAADITLSSALVDALPGNVVVAGTPAAGKTCAGGTWNPDAGAVSVSYSGGTIPASGSCTLQVNVTSSVDGAYNNVIPAGALVTTAGRNAQPASATLIVGGGTAPPTVAKSFSPATIAAGGTSTLTITLGNANAGALTLTADMVDTLPANVVLANPPNIGGTCTTASVTASAGGGTVTYANTATIPSGGCTITVSVTSSVAGSYTNTIAADALRTGGGNNAQPATAGLVVQAPIPPSVEKSYSIGTINPGGVTRMTITLGNANASAITLNANLVDTLPAQLTVAASPNIGGTCTTGLVTAVAGGGTVTYASGATIPAGGCTIEVDLTSSVSGGPWTNTIAAGALQTTAGNNGAPATANLFVNPPQPPSITKSFSPATVAKGGVSTLTIAFANGNLTAATLTADLVDALPGGLKVADTPNIRASAGCDVARVTATAGATTVRYASGATIPANGGCSIVIDVTPPTAQTYTNTIAAGALQTSVGNNAVAATASLKALEWPVLTKSFTPAIILAGGNSTLTLTLANANNEAITLTSALVDTLPSGVVLANPATVGGTCTAGSVTATAGGGTVTYASGAAIPATTGCTITVPVTAADGGRYVNTIAANVLRTNAGNNAAPATATLTVRHPPTVAKAFAPAAILPGATSRLTITLGNINAVDATLSEALVDNLPGYVTVANPPNVGGTCTTASVTAAAGGGTITYAAGAAIPATTGCSIAVDVTASVLGTHVNTISAAALKTSVGNNRASASDSLLVITGPGLAKSFSPTTILAGGTSTLTLTLANINPGNLALTQPLVDTLPAGLVVAMPATVGGTCAAGSVTAVAGGNTVIYAAGAPLPSGGCTITVPVTAATSGSYVNTFPVGALKTGAGDSPGQPTATLTVLGPPAVSKSFAPAVILPGGVSTLTLSLSNGNGTAATLNSALTDALPAGMALATPATAGGTCTKEKVTATTGGGTVTYASGAAIPAGGCTITVPVTAAASGSYVNTIPAGALKTSAGDNANPTTATLTVPWPPTVAKSFAPSAIGPAGVSRLTISLGNGNAFDALLTEALVDTLPAGVTLANPANVGGSCPQEKVTAAAGGNTVTYAKDAAIPAGGCDIAVDVTSATLGAYVNTIPVDGLKTSVGNNQTAASATLQVLSGPGLAKSFAPTEIPSGGVSVLTLSLINVNNTAISLTAALVDTLPAGVTLASPATVGGTCPGTVTAAAGSNTVTYTSGAVIPAGGCTITVPVTASTGGNYVNTIPAGSLQTSIGANPAPATATLQVLASPPTVAKAFAPTAIPPGGKTRLTIALGNANPVAIALTEPVVDTLPAGMKVANPPDIGGTCPGTVIAVAGGGTVTYPAEALIPPGGCTVEANVTVAGPGTYVNTIVAGKVVTPAGRNKQPATVALTVEVMDIPTLSEWGLLLLSLWLAWVGMERVRRERR